MGRFDGLFYTIPVEHHNWDGYASPRAGFPGNDAMPRTHMYMGFSVAVKEGTMEVPHIHHAVDEYLVFTGADLVNFFDSFDAEVEVWLGEDPLNMEKITITKPTVIRVPPNLWHCPIRFKRVGKPVCFIPLYLDGDWSKITRIVDDGGMEAFQYEGAGLRRCVKDRSKKCVYCGRCFSEAAREQEERGAADDYIKPFYEMENTRNPTGLFNRFVYTMEPEYHEWGETFANPRAGYPGIQVDEEARVYFGYDIILKPCPMDEPHIHHAVEEYLIFTGADLMDPFRSFDAEITLMVGDDPDHMEEHVITEPTLVRIPPHVWHCPIEFKRVGKPVNFMPIYPDGRWSKISRQIIRDDGTPTYVYEAVGLARCRLDGGKTCTYCGKCYSMALDGRER